MKSMKKLVLVAFVLLASVMGLVLMGCDTPLEPVDNVNTTTTPESKGQPETPESKGQPETPKFTVTFDKNAENATGEMASQTFTQGEAKELPANSFVRPTWTFSGWSTNKEAATPEYGDKAQFSATKDTTLYAIWTDNGTVTPVTFTTQDGTKFFYGETVTVTLATTTEGATIKYKLDDGNWQDYSSPIAILSQNTITAKATKEGLKDSEETSVTYTVRKLTSISITPPTRTVYSVRERFDSTGMEVIATYDDGETREVNTWTTDFDEITSKHGLDKVVTVSYTEGEEPVTNEFTVDVASYQFTETVQDVESDYTGTASATSKPAVTDPIYKKFGDWPQTIMGKGVTVGSKTLVRGGFTYHVGSDGNYYVKAAGDAHGNTYQYSDGTKVGKGGTSERWFKVEPIVWRVLTEDYNSTGRALLLAEKILTGGIPWDDDKNNYMESNIRKWLNGNSGSEKQSDYNGDAGFLQTAFTTSARNLIAETTVDNSVASTIPKTLTEEQKKSDWKEGKNDYACGDDTKDKIFLLSEQEATTEGYGFDVYDASGEGNTRIRVTTDYAKATRAFQSSKAGEGGWCWLRSSSYSSVSNARCFHESGNARDGINVESTGGGVVPALSISLQ